MFGTIGRATVKPGHQDQLTAMHETWKREIRPKIPGYVIELVGYRAGQLDQAVFLVLTQDEATYRQMAEMPEQHQFFLRFNEVFADEPTWEDVEMEWGVQQ